MDYTIRYDEPTNVVVVRSSGKMEMRDFPNLVDDIVVELQSRKSACLLADHSDSSAAELETQDIKRMSGLAQRLSEVLRDRQFAVVLKEDVDYGLGRMWQTLTDEDVPFEISVFRTVDKAREWLPGSGRQG